MVKQFHPEHSPPDTAKKYLSNSSLVPPLAQQMRRGRQKRQSQQNKIPAASASRPVTCRASAFWNAPKRTATAATPTALFSAPNAFEYSTMKPCTRTATSTFAFAVNAQMHPVAGELRGSNRSFKRPVISCKSIKAQKKYTPFCFVHSGSFKRYCRWQPAKSLASTSLALQTITKSVGSISRTINDRHNLAALHGAQNHLALIPVVRARRPTMSRPDPSPEAWR